ncbi:Transcriptional regulator, GntR family [Halomonas citrativorans]|uniref:Transcriptional regulator, GntR family n=1 Tax=Halomonas citrativorans TaxID=2742612 RepID=A0A1R4HNC4_9GAMM|nr:GntR family transcriptional regulator [Halomonas citrativorans]SJN09041.1 Transcriptional regulator, GntR family [Halomonas citrativorans]
MEASDETSLSDMIAIKLRNAIILGEIAPGTALVESGLCKQYQASRNTIREALRQLRYEGLIHYILNKGAQVRVLTLSDIRDIYKVRHTLELSAIQHSSLASDRHFESIDRILTEGEEAAIENRWNAVGTSSLFFHHAIVGLLESERLSTYFSTILAQLRLIFAMSSSEKRFQGGWLERDRRIYALLAAGQRAEAAEQMQLYLYESESYVSDIVLAYKTR